MYRSILVPLDGSTLGEHALPVAAAIAVRAGATIHLVHVHVLYPVVYVEGLPVIDDELRSQSRAHEATYLQRVADRLHGQAGVTVTTHVLDRPVVPALLGYAADAAIDLIVMTTHGLGGLARAWLGSVADQLVRGSMTPTLLVRPRSDEAAPIDAPPLHQMLIALDGSPLAEAILDPALALGDLLGMSYTLVRVVPPMDADSTDAHAIEAQRYLHQVAQRLSGTRQPVNTEVVHAPHAAPALLDTAHTSACDVIAMTTHGRSGVRRLLLGSVADKVLRGANRCVLLYRPPAIDQGGEPEG